MRRTYISPEYTKKNIYGTYNMVEESNFFSTKMLKLENIIAVDNEQIIWFEKNNGEQINLSVESSLDSKVYDGNNNKIDNHKLYYNEDIDRWILEIDIKKILNNYLFATLKRWRTFEGVTSNSLISKSVNVELRKYINNNISNKFKFKEILLNIGYIDISNTERIKLESKWDNSISNKLNKLEILEKTDNKLTLSFKQEKDLDKWVINYNFDIIYNKK